MPMHTCVDCGCHVLESACSCPHCGATLKTCSLGAKSKAAMLMGLVAASGCIIKGEPEYGVVINDTVDSAVDADGDGYSVADGDCDDADASVNPEATETAGDGVDSNCDGADDT